MPYKRGGPRRARWAAGESLKLISLTFGFVILACSPPGRGQGPVGSAPTEERATQKHVNAIVMGVLTTVSTSISPPGVAGSPPGLDSVEELLNTGLAVNDDKGLLQPRLAIAVPTLENGMWKL